MNILYVNTYYHGGGAEKVMRQLYQGICEEDIRTYCMVGRIQENIPEDVQIIYTSFLDRALITVAGGRLRNTLLTASKARNEIIRCIEDHQIDIVHFHNLHSNYIGLRDLVAIQEHCPHIVITLHDMWAMTGGCAHAFSCDRWEKAGCQSCAGNESMQAFTKAAFLLQEKKRALTGKGIHFVVPSQWLEQCCNKGILQYEQVTQIYNGISLQHFTEHDQMEIRRKYGLPLDKHVLLFAANGLQNVYKGFSYLADALQQLMDKEDYVLAVVGNKDGETLDLPFDIHSYGYIRDEQTMSELYSAADLFMLSSVADTLPFTPMEAMASGTPVMAFATGGIPEIVSEDVGWAVPTGDVAALAHAIEAALDTVNHMEYIRKRSTCRSRIEQVFDEQIMLRQYISLYRKIILENDQ